VERVRTELTKRIYSTKLLQQTAKTEDSVSVGMQIDWGELWWVRKKQHQQQCQ